MEGKSVVCNVVCSSLASAGVSRALLCWARWRMVMLHLHIAGAAVLRSTARLTCRLGKKLCPTFWSSVEFALHSISCPNSIATGRPWAWGAASHSRHSSAACWGNERE